MQTRATRLIHHLLANGEATTENGESLVDTIVRDLVERAAKRRLPGWDRDSDFAERYPKLAAPLGQDGFVVKEGQLRRTTPTALGLPATDDEVHELHLAVPSRPSTRQP